MATTVGKLAPEAFVRAAIQDSCDQGWLGCHTIYSGFDEAYRAYFGTDPDDVLAQMEKDGIIRIRDARNGVGKMLYLANNFVPKAKVQDLIERITHGK